MRPYSPAALLIVQAAERIQKCVNVGTDGQAEVFEIVTGVDRHGQLVRREDAIKTQRKFGAANAARKRDYGV